MEGIKENDSNNIEVRERSILDIMHLSNGLGSVEALERLGIYISVKKPLRINTSKLYPSGERS